jgi:fatty-acyl-CoA synthase
VLVTLAPFPGVDLWDKVSMALADVASLQHLVLVELAPHVPGLARAGAQLMQWRAWRGLTVPTGLCLHRYAQAIAAQPTDRTEDTASASISALLMPTRSHEMLARWRCRRGRWRGARP